MLDFLGQRVPWGNDVVKLPEVAAQKAVALRIASFSSYIDHAWRKTLTAAERLQRITSPARLAEIIPIARAIVEAALGLDFTDFEDGLPYCAARAVPASEAIVTHDPRGFTAGVRPVLAPPATLARRGR